MKLGHIALSVANIARSAAFYKKHFGLRVSKRYSFKDKGMTIVLLKNKDMTLELFEFKKRKPLPQYRKTLDNDLHTLGVKHFSLETGNIEAAFKKFKQARVGLATDLRVFADGRKYFFLKDPDGNLVELMES
ncbi:MAG TPA: VOC family protein [Candidatus Omnitrophota bacterium]|nr:VOC family protein [Candidatus Omnitrophota bacterium]HRZ15429.1 VOC family protein [Candidatus Omnitrophota bacterium]